MSAPYLSTESLTLRTMVASDARVSACWFPVPFPVDAEAAGRWLSAEHRMAPWDDPSHLWLVIVRPPTGADEADGTADDIVGSVRIGGPRARTSNVALHLSPALGPDRVDELQTRVIELIVPWLRDELGSMVVTLGIGSDQPRSIVAVDGLGMVRAARLREHLARPGHRVDLLWYQALGPVPRITDALPIVVDAGPEPA